MAGIEPHYFTQVTNQHEPTKQLIAAVQERILDETVDTSVILKQLGRHAVKRISQLMDSDNDHIALKAAQDLADRSPDTSKTQKLDVTGALTLGHADARDLAAAMVESARLREQYRSVVTEGLVELDTDKRADTPALTLVPGDKK